MLDRLRTRLGDLIHGRRPEGSVHQRTMHGLPVTILNTRPDISTDSVFDRLDLALQVIRDHAPRRYRRLQADVREMIVQRFPCRGAFFPEQQAVLTELTFLVNPDFIPEQIAASIVHEGTHARVARVLRSDVANRRPREERLCRQAELEFGLALPNGAAVVERARASLAMADAEVAPDVDWDEAWRRVGEESRRDH
jgi:hypothetical protein